jgi:anti-sigma regulatory factor (Ser/Thr protein kinase)
VNGPGHGHGEAVLHDGDEGAVAAAAPVLRAALERGDAVVLGCAEPRLSLLSAAVGDDPRLVVLPPQEVWRRPVPAIATYLGMVERQTATGRSLCVVTDSEFGSGPVEWSEWARFEAASHALTEHYPVDRYCLLDRRRAPGDVLDAARRLHPVVWRTGVPEPSPAYETAAESVHRYGYVAADPMEAGVPTVRLADVTAATDLLSMRRALSGALARAGLPPWQAHEFLLAAGEVASNALRHGRAPVAVRLWTSARRLLCTVTDRGSGFDYPLSSYLAPDPARGGLGLYLARQLCDQLNVCWTPDGFTVRLALVLD